MGGEEEGENYAARATADPMAKCYLPGVPRIMYLDYPFHIFQTRDAVAITFEWSQVFRLIHTNGTQAGRRASISGWATRAAAGRATRWSSPSPTTTTSTWFDRAGNFHSEQLKLEERFTLVDADTLRYEVTVEDPKVFTRPWKISMPLYRQKDMDRILEYQCQAEASEANGAFERDPKTWFPGR